MTNLLLSFAALKHNEIFERSIEKCVLLMAVLRTNKRIARESQSDSTKKLTFKFKQDYHKFLSTQTGLTEKFIKLKFKRMIMKGECHYNDNNTISYNETVMMPISKLKNKVAQAKTERCSEMRRTFNPKYKYSELQNYVVISPAFLEFQKKHGLTLSECVVLFYLNTKKDLTSNRQMSYKSMSNTLCMSKDAILPILKTLASKGLIVFNSGKSTFQNNYIAVNGDVVKEIEAVYASKKGSRGRYNTRSKKAVSVFLYTTYGKKRNSTTQPDSIPINRVTENNVQFLS